MNFNKEIQNSNEKLNIIYRVCDFVNVCSVGGRCFSIDKNKLIKKCLLSLKTNIENYKGNLDFYCIADNCSTDLVNFIQENFKNVIIRCYAKLGNARSFCMCVDLACTLPDNEQVYFLEDDYLFLNDNVLNLINYNLTQLSIDTQKYCAIFPDDYPDRYKENVNSFNTELRVTNSGHFARIFATTCTFVTYTNVIKVFRNDLLNFINWPIIGENESINRLWQEVPLYQSLPALTLHSQLTDIIPRYLDYNKLNNYFIG